MSRVPFGAASFCMVRERAERERRETERRHMLDLAKTYERAVVKTPRRQKRLANSRGPDHHFTNPGLRPSTLGHLNL